MKKPVLLHGVLLSAALVAAYLTWTRDQTSQEDETQVLSLRGNLDRVIFNGEDRTVEIDRRKDDTGAYHWVRVETMETPPPPPPKPAPPPPPAPPPETKAEPKKAEPKKAEPKKAEPKKAEPKKAEPKKAEPKKAEPKKAEPKKAEPKKAEPKKADSLSRDPKADPEKKEAKKPEARKAEPKKAEPKKAELKKAELKLDVKAPPKVEPKAEPKPIKIEPPKPLPKVKKVQQFKGNKSVDELLKGLANLSAVRSLGKVDAEKLKAFGLDNSKKTLTLVSGSSPRVFVIGGNTYGNMDTYIQSKEDGRVYVVRPRLLQDFQYAEYRLMDRALHGFENNELEKAVVTSPDGKKRALVQQNRRDPAGAYWADEATPQQKKDFFRNWMAKVLGLRVIEYVPADKKLEGLKELMRVDYLAAGKPIGFLRLFKQPTLIPKVGPTDEGAGEYFAITENSRAYIKLARPSGDEVARDIANVMKE